MEHIPMDDPEVFLEMFEKEAKELRKLNINMIRSRYVSSRRRLGFCRNDCSRLNFLCRLPFLLDQRAVF